MEKLYAQALWKTIENGHSPKESVDSLFKLLQKQGRADLMPRIGRAFTRLTEAKRGNRVRIFVADEKEAKHALKASGVSDAEVVVDQSLIGGWRLEGDNMITDRSFKKYLIDIYNAAITT